MTAIEIARQFSALNQPQEAVRAYTLALHQAQAPEEELEAALYILQNGGDYKIAYTTFVDLHRRGCFQEECLSVLTHAFYEPNVKLLKTRYENNKKLLEKYPYLFRKDFLDFEFLPMRFYPYDDNQFIPYDIRAGRFREYIDFKRPVVSRNFFKDLEKPILAEDVFSQYELEYLNDSVRPSQWIGRDNHIYLHYPNWGVFCSYLQCWNLRSLLEDEKFVFLIGDELSQYPIDFQARFGMDYSAYPVKPVGIREVNRLIWHTQLSSHNGGDFFNQIFDIHPNLLMITSVMYDSLQETLAKIEKWLSEAGSTREAVQCLSDWSPRLVEELYLLRDRTEKDLLVGFFLQHALDYEKRHARYLDKGARIAPVLFFQPHFHNIIYQLRVDSKGRTLLESEQYESIRTSPLFRGFKYIKTFTPVRRFTTSHGATLKFMCRQRDRALSGEPQEKKVVIPDVVSQRVMNRSFMIDWQDRLYADSVLVRFEDGKLNPKATFTALAAFLDLPYTQTMTYCSLNGETDPEEMAGNVRGFDAATVFRDYEEFANESERTYIECFLRDAYEYCGYDFQSYDGQPMDEERAAALVDDFTTINGLMGESWRKAMEKSGLQVNGKMVSDDAKEQVLDQMIDQRIKGANENRIKNARVLLRGLRFVNRHGQPLHMMPKLELDPGLLEQPLYH